MLSIDPSSRTERENYKLLIGTVIPRPIAFVTTLSDRNVINGAPFSYFNLVATDPPMLSIAVQRSGGARKDTARNSLARKQFVVHVVDEQNVLQINQTAARLSPSQSEIEAAALTPVTSSKIAVPGIKEAKVRFECVLEQAIELGGARPTCDLIIGRVVHYHIQDDLYDHGRIDARKLAAVSRLAGVNYAKLGDFFSIDRP
ncbi:flavin reductase family protein [Sporolactobacillus terrae]|uniref:Flavin reductase n=1 Tax=Sporolactobacillus terrae TaxID=269673 RepID=A0A5K7WT51_9BACL|nr:flavin reductase family protein [Sporolactobacillus terrae]BBN97665.1 flavin reductase [Sporolactobacillus terrae]